jgi:hypothetical protein
MRACLFLAGKTENACTVRPCIHLSKRSVASRCDGRPFRVWQHPQPQQQRACASLTVAHPRICFVAHALQTTHPVTDSAVKDRVVKKVQDAVLSKWQNEPNRIDKRALCLIYMAHASDVLENAFAPLSDDDYELAMKRVRELLDVDPDVECTKPNSNDVVWGVVAAFLK